MADTVRVVVVEMEPISRRGLVGVLQEANGIEVVGSASTASDAFNLIDDASPDVALVGTTIADFPGLYDTYKNSPDAALRDAIAVPLGDPLSRHRYRRRYPC